jgi:hypothetical protein
VATAMFSFPFLLPDLFLDCVWHQKHFENLQGKFLSRDRENKKMRFVNKKKKKKSQLETTRKRGGSIV